MWHRPKARATWQHLSQRPAVQRFEDLFSGRADLELRAGCKNDPWTPYGPRMDPLQSGRFSALPCVFDCILPLAPFAPNAGPLHALMPSAQGTASISRSNPAEQSNVLHLAVMALCKAARYPCFCCPTMLHLYMNVDESYQMQVSCPLCICQLHPTAHRMLQLV